MPGKTVKARSNSGLSKLARKVKKAAKGLSPSGMSSALGDYLLQDTTPSQRAKKPTAKRKKVMVNGRN